MQHLAYKHYSVLTEKGEDKQTDQTITFVKTSFVLLYKRNYVEKGIYQLIAGQSDLFSRYCLDHVVHLREIPVLGFMQPRLVHNTTKIKLNRTTEARKFRAGMKKLSAAWCHNYIEGLCASKICCCIPCCFSTACLAQLFKAQRFLRTPSDITSRNSVLWLQSIFISRVISLVKDDDFPTQP